MKKTNKRGISLIVLVITIIVMIILAAAIILSLSNSGIIGKANEAKNKSDEANLLEAANLAAAEWELENKLNNHTDAVGYITGKLTAQGFTEKQIREKLNIATDGKVSLKDEETWDNSQAYLFEITENGMLTGVKEEYLSNIVYGEKKIVYADKEHTEEIIELVIPDSVTSLGSHVFVSYYNLTSIKIPDSVTSIESGAFVYCLSLQEVILPDSITSIKSDMFAGCSSLTSITIPVGVTSIGDCAFVECTALTDVYYKGTKEQWEAITIDVENDDLLSATIHYNSK